MDVDIKDCTSVYVALVQAGIEPIDGNAYTLYECGHAFNVVNDPSRVQWYGAAGRGLRSCPVCDHKKLLTKYKQCGCGEVQIGSKVQPSKCCNVCPTERKGITASPFAYRKNGHLADPDRGFCIHRNECLTKFIDYVTVPCKGCLKFFVLQGDHDALAEVITG
jgi:hypothetical protein